MTMLFSPTIGTAIAAGVVHRRNSSGSSAIFAAIRRGSSLLTNFAADRLPIIYSITLSARTSTTGGIERPSARESLIIAPDGAARQD
jgi:hypothetical protein